MIHSEQNFYDAEIPETIDVNGSPSTPPEIAAMSNSGGIMTAETMIAEYFAEEQRQQDLRFLGPGNY